PGPLLGILEVTQDITSDYETVLHLQRLIILTTFLGSAALYGLIFFLIRKADRVLDERLRDKDRLEKELLQNEKLASMGRMVASIAHEIRNPLTGIHGYLYAMDEICDDLPETEPVSVLRATIAKIRKAAGKMESVIRRVLDFSKPGTPRLELLDLSVPTQEGLSLMLPTLRKAGITVDTDFAPVPAILGDRMQLEQAVINIVDNAARAVRN
ncbi:hypothetical protein JWG42_18420, partial [Desulfoprunum benzoelyticum]|uniref:sensor histidine kinase n=1 Tax=Desulfoprunum benzoelyticum TaxID=1506996 RepID=UPI0023DD009C